MSRSAKIKLSVLAYETVIDGIKKGTIPSEILENFDLRNGTADGEIDLVYSDTISTVAAGATTVYSLDGGVNDSEGNAITFAEVALIAIRNKRETAQALLKVGPDAATGFGTLTLERGFWVTAADRSVIAPDSWMVLYNKDGVVVDATHADLDVETSGVAGATNSWDIIILGRSA